MSAGEWFLRRDGAPPWAARVYCFPHAGGNARTFLDWQPALADDAEIVAVCTPGRASRAGEPLPPFDELAAGAAAAIAAAAAGDPRPIFLFGHSLGGLVAFEVARRLRGLPTLRHLVASGISAPSLLPSPRVRQLAALEGREFAEALGFFGGLPPEVVADEELHDVLLPGVIADFRFAAGYVYRPAPPLEIDVTLVNGRQDPHVGEEQLAPWRQECRRVPSYRWSAGGHFYFDDDPSLLHDLLVEVIRADQHVELI